MSEERTATSPPEEPAGDEQPEPEGAPTAEEAAPAPREGTGVGGAEIATPVEPEAATSPQASAPAEAAEADGGAAAEGRQRAAELDPELAARVAALEAEVSGEPAAEPAVAAPAATAGEESRQEPQVDPAVARLRQARDEGRVVEGKVFGWNPGGFHVVIDGVAAFCPRSEMEAEAAADPESYLDQIYPFKVLKIRDKGKRVVVSRAAAQREDQRKRTAKALGRLEPGAVARGAVSSLTDFGAFIDLGGVEGLVHVSEISRSRVAKPADALQVGQEVEVKVLKVERGGKRISLSMKALEPDPWREVKQRFPEGTVVSGRVERTAGPGAFIELEPGLTGLLPTSEMGLPREAIPARVYPPGKEVRVQVMSVDPRRRRISLAPEGSKVGGTRGDYLSFVEKQQGERFGALAAAFEKAKKED